MAYGDGLMVLGLELTAVQVETAAAVVKAYPVPVPMTVLAAGAYVTEDFVAQSTSFKLELGKLDKVGGTKTSLTVVEIDNANTSLKKGDGVKAAVTALTADTDIDNGHVVLMDNDAFPVKFQPGEVINLEVTQAAGSAGGAVIPFVVVRVDGLNMVSTKVLSHID